MLLADGEIDVVFGKDSWIHDGDKGAFFSEVYRVLKPGGILTAGDWMRSEKPYGKDMEHWFKMEGLIYHMNTIDEYGQILRECGFIDIELKDIAEAYRVKAHEEYLSMLGGPLRGAMLEILGAEKQAHFVENWRAMTVVLESGKLHPSHFRARKPL